MDRLERERTFHNKQVEEGFRSRRLLDRMQETYCDKQQDSIMWAQVWRELDLNGKTVLDYGCGAGDLSYELTRRAPTARVYGIDLSDSLIALAQKGVAAPGAQKPEFSVQDAHQTDFPSGCFDVVFGQAILHHLEMQRAFGEIARILKPGGRAFFAEPLGRHPIVRLVRWATPSARSADERPLNIKAISQADEFFAKVRHTEFYFLAVAAAPLNLISPRAAGRAVKLLHRVDHALLAAIPGLRPYAWYTLIEFQKS